MPTVTSSLPLSLVLLAAVAAGNALADPPPLEGDARRGAELAPLCTSCHGRDGHSRLSRYPSIAGMEPTEFQGAMRALQAGERGHLMASMTRGLSEQDVADLAAYFANQ